jgi:type II secretory pathway pseudopilin PulG
LLELLIVVMIIAVLVTIVVTSLASARRKAQVAVARSNIQAIKAALSMYESDTGKFPKRASASPPTNTACFQNDISIAYAALRNRAVAQTGGGPNSPYLDWKPEQIGYVGQSGWDAYNYGYDPGHLLVSQPSQWGPGSAIPPGCSAIGLTPGDPATDPTSFQNQQTHCPASTGPTANDFIFLDPWGNPYVYVEWASVPTSTKDGFTPTTGVSFTPNLSSAGGGNTAIFMWAHDPSKFDIWSWGPNGINEGGNGDDVTSWTDVRK